MAEKILFIIANEGFRDEELLEPFELVKTEGFEPVIAAKEKGTCTGKLGATIEADIALTDVNAEEYAAIALVGGPGALSYKGNSDLRKIILDAREADLVIGAICISPLLLADFDMIDHMHATVFPNDEALGIFKEHKVMHIPQEVVVDEWLVTADGPKAATMYGQNLVDLIREREKTE